MARSVPLKPTTVRFSTDGTDLVQQAADAVGSTFSQFVREAALIRAAWVLRQGEGMSALAEEVRRMARDKD